MQRDNSIRNDACRVNFSALVQKEMEADADRGRTKLRDVLVMQRIRRYAAAKRRLRDKSSK
jgi:hypothetical protein